MNFSEPASCSFISQSTWTAPSRIAVWASCPQACITPGTCEEKGQPVFSWMLSASMSARSAMHGPGRAPFRSATTP